MTFKFLAFSSLAIISALGSASAQSTEPEVYTIPGLIDDDTSLPTDTVPEIDLLQLLINEQEEEEASETNATVNLQPDSIAVDSLPSFEELLLIEQERLKYPLEIDTSIDVSGQTMPMLLYMPIVYKPFDINLTEKEPLTVPSPQKEVSLTQPVWIQNEVNRYHKLRVYQQEFCTHYPWVVKLNLESLPEPPKKYVATVDPKSATITISEVKIDIKEANKEIEGIKVNRKNWLHTFTGSLQFSQAYNSPNWYQGGNNNLNLISNFVWNVKLNQKYHPNLLFENTVQYKLAINNAPDDELRNYSISEDRFQINTNFGLKAAYNWYYSVNMQFKTQLLNNHPKNSTALTAAFLAPAELNLGIGMTYSSTTPNKKASFNLSIAPLSYNMIAYANKSVTAYRGKAVTNQYGSNLEAKMTWRPTYNITYSTRLYTFTNYEYLQGDWENTISFDINRFLTTQIYVHLRYDSSTKKREDTKWHQWQLKEILSFGFSYKFSSL